MLRQLPICLVIAASLLLVSCTTVEFAYNAAPSYLAGEFEDAFDANQAQRDAADEAIARFFAWHRQNELERYQQVLDNAADSMQDGIRADEFLHIRHEIRQAWHRSMKRLSEDFAPSLASLSPEQIDHYEQYFEEKGEKYDEYLAMDEARRTEFRAEEGLENLEEWFGDLSDRQRDAFAARLRQLPEFYESWIVFRKARQQAFLTALRQAPDKGVSARQLQAIVIDPDSAHARAFQPHRAAYWQAYARMIEDLSPSLSSMQIEHAVSRLGNYADDIGKLASND